MLPYLAIYLIDIAALLFLYVLMNSNNLLCAHRKRSFLYGIVFTILVILSEIGTVMVFEGQIRFRGWNIFFNVLGFAFTPIIPMILTAVFDAKSYKTHISLLLPTFINVLAVLLSPFFGLIFYVDANNFYSRGDFFYIFVAVYIFNLIYLGFRTVYACQRSLYPIKFKIISLSVFIIAGTFIQLLIPSIHSSWHCVTLSLFMLYIYLSEFDSSFDILTGLYTRSAFEKALTQLKNRRMLSVIVMDIDSFKEINDTYGHEYGDTVLKEVGAIIRNSFDDRIACYRIGGDEFCVIRRDARRENLKLQIELMIKNLAEARQNDRILPTISYGYSVFQGDEAPDIQKILKQADDQMYCYKNSKRSEN